MSCTSNKIPPNQFLLSLAWHRMAIHKNGTKNFGYFGKGEKIVTRKVLFYYRHFPKTTRLSVQKVNADGLYTLAETLCLLYGSARTFHEVYLNIKRN